MTPAEIAALIERLTAERDRLRQICTDLRAMAEKPTSPAKRHARTVRRRAAYVRLEEAQDRLTEEVGHLRDDLDKRDVEIARLHGLLVRVNAAWTPDSGSAARLIAQVEGPAEGWAPIDPLSPSEATLRLVSDVRAALEGRKG